MAAPPDLRLTLNRIKVRPYFTHGEMLVNGLRLGYTREPAGFRRLDSPPLDIVPAGEYRVVVSFSELFQRHVPEVVGVPGFDDVRIHGCDLIEPRSGHVLLGKEMTPDGVRETAAVNKILVSMIGEAINTNHKCWIEINGIHP